MCPTLPIAVRLTPAFARSRVSLADLLARIGPQHRGQASLWRLSSREWAFARAVLTDHTRLWLWRTDPQARAGDFVVVDMSSPDWARRPIWVIDLKCNAPIKFGGGGAGVSLTRASHAVTELADQGVVAEVAPTLVTGDGRHLLGLWQAS